MLRTHKAGKGPGGCRGWALGSRNRRGPGVTPPLVSEGRGPHLGAQQASWSRMGRANTLLSSPAPPVWEGPWAPPTFLSWSPWPPSYAPKDPCSLEGGLEGRGSAWELSSLPGPNGPGNHPLLLSCSSQRVPPTCLSWSPWPQDANPVWPPLLLSPQSPYILLVHFGVPPISLGIRVTPSSWQAP